MKFIGVVSTVCSPLSKSRKWPIGIVLSRKLNDVMWPKDSVYLWIQCVYGCVALLRIIRFSITYTLFYLSETLPLNLKLFVKVKKKVWYKCHVVIYDWYRKFIFVQVFPTKVIFKSRPLGVLVYLFYKKIYTNLNYNNDQNNARRYWKITFVVLL